MATRTIPVSGNGTGTLSFQNTGPGVLDIESVLAVIDTGGAGDTTATLTITSPAGNDVAAVPQSQPVAGGGSGRATWALRLAEDGTSAPPPAPFQLFDVDHEGGWLKIVGNDGNPISGLTVELAANAGGFGNGNMRLAAQNALLLDAAGNILMTAADWAVTTNHAFIGTVSAGVIIGLPVGTSVTITDHDDNPIFRVNEDGSLQGKTGQSLTFNL